MRVVGLIAEYNPFHNGHQFHMSLAKKTAKADFVVVIMSGQFVQRGEPAIINKWERTKAALHAGADLVIELPVVFATSSAEFFSTASVKLLDDLGMVDAFCFGSESGELQQLNKVANILQDEPNDYKELLAKHLAKGLNFPTARNIAISEYTTPSTASVLKTSNNILGVEYLKALKRIKSTMTPLTIKRVGADYHDKNLKTQIASASGIRQALFKSSDLSVIEPHVTNMTFKTLEAGLKEGIAPIFYNDFFTLLKYTLLKKNKTSISNILDVTEGLENRLLNYIDQAEDMNSFLDIIGTKRYTRTKLQRALVHLMLDITKSDFKKYLLNGYSQYVRVLGFKTASSDLMKALKDKSKIPVVVNVKHAMNQLTSLQKTMLESEIHATEIYNTVVFDKFGTKAKNDYTQPIIKMI